MQTRPHCVPLCNRSTAGRRNGTTAVQRPADRQTQASAHLAIKIQVRDPRASFEPWAIGQLRGFHSKLSRRNVMLHAFKLRMMGPRGGNGSRNIRWQFRQARWGYKVTGFTPHNRMIFRRSLRQIALSACQRRSGTGQTRLRQCHIRAGHLTHIKAIFRSTQFLLNQFYIGRPQGYKLHRPAVIHMRLHRPQKHVLLNRHQRLPGRQNTFLQRFGL